MQGKPGRGQCVAGLCVRRYASATALDTLATCYGNCAALLMEYYQHYFELARDPERAPLRPLAPNLLQARVARPLGMDTLSIDCAVHAQHCCLGCISRCKDKEQHVERQLQLHAAC